MTDFFRQLFLWQADVFRHLLMGGLEVFLWVLGGIVTIVVLFIAYVDISSALRRQERARCFLRLLEIGIKQGRSLERTIISLSQSHVQTLGVHFHLLAAYLEEGLSITAALEKVPWFLPPPVRAMLKVGEEIGDVRRIIPACQRALKEGTSGTRSSLDNLVVLLFVSPIGPLLVWMIAIWIVPKMKDIAADMIGFVPPGSEQMFSWSSVIASILILLWLIVCPVGFFRDISPRLGLWLTSALEPLSHRFASWLPWRLRRMQRDFSFMLALLLDAEVPEEKAVRLAAQSTANGLFIARAERVVQDLRQGVPLTDAVRWLDDAGEFRWRLRNATQPNRGFLAALLGWHEALEAKAFQQEQAASQIVTTSFVFLNALMVGLMALGMFRILVAIIQEAAL